MSVSEKVIRQPSPIICLVGLNNAFDNKGYRCYFGNLSDIAFLNISIQMQHQLQSVISFYVNEFHAEPHERRRQDYIEFENTKYPIRKILRKDNKYDFNFFTFKMAAHVMTAFVNDIISYYLSTNQIFTDRMLIK